FGVVSLSLSWAKGANWPLLQAGCFHNHLCPGLNAGYLAAVYLRQHLPLGKGQRYVFIGAPSICAMDALQVLTDATPGKRGSYSLLVKGDVAAKYFPKGAGPLVIAARIDGKADKCQGVVLGLAWNKLCQDMGLERGDMSPPGGKSNPLFFISRAKLSLGLAGMPLKKKMSYVIKVKGFSGKASLAERIIAAGPDPYSLIMSP
ncbi:MAG: FmdE family protein, partial [Desulfarculaceae bacterium]